MYSLRKALRVWAALYDRQHFPDSLGLAGVLDADSLPVNHPGLYEYIAYSGIGWWPCDVPLV